MLHHVLCVSTQYESNMGMADSATDDENYKYLVTLNTLNGYYRKKDDHK